MRIVEQRKPVENVSYSLMFMRKDDPGSGYSFDCDENGNLLKPEETAGNPNYQKCVSGEYNVEPARVERFVNRYVNPAVGICEKCGRQVVLEDGFANTCKCGAEYNMSGQRLAPRSQWGEETGERF